MGVAASSFEEYRDSEKYEVKQRQSTADDLTELIAHIFRIRRKVRSERDFEYFL